MTRVGLRGRRLGQGEGTRRQVIGRGGRSRALYLVILASALGIALVGCSNNDEYERLRIEVNTVRTDVAVLNAHVANLVDLIENPPQPQGKVIPAWVPGTSIEQAQADLDMCLTERLTTVLGPLGSALGADVFDFEEFADAMGDVAELGTLPGVQGTAFSLWFAGSILGCWTGALE